MINCTNNGSILLTSENATSYGNFRIGGVVGRALGAEVVIATADGSVGIKGFVTDAIAQQVEGADYFFSCGPLPMLKALTQSLDIDGQISLEERMGCGFGICMGCSIQTASGAKRVCKEGPVFRKEEIIW